MSTVPQSPQSKAGDDRAKQPQTQSDMAELKAKLAEAEAKIAELTRAQDEGANQKSVRRSEIVVRGEGYTFTVGPRAEVEGCPKKTIECCDESEAIRWYIATTEDPKRPGKQIDPVKIPITATCVDRGNREANIKRQKRLAFIRQKIDNGHPVDEFEIAELEGIS